jgi:hypothetical protein
MPEQGLELSSEKNVAHVLYLLVGLVSAWAM